MAKSVVKSIFSLHPLPVISSPEPPFFAHFNRFWVKNHLLRGVFLFTLREILARNLILRRKNQFDGDIFRPKYPKFDFCRRRKEESRRLSSPYHRRRNIKTRKVLPKNKHKDEKTQDHHEKDKGQNQKANVLHGKDQAQPSKTNCFSPLPHSTRKIQANFLSKRPHFPRLPPLFLSKPPYPHKFPFNPTRRTRAYAYIRARALSEFAIFAFTLHISPQQTVYQLLECEDKSCIHLHLHHNNLKFNTLHDFLCKKQVKAKG